MLDGSSFVSYGEFVKLDDNVIFSMPVGGAPDQPRLQVAMVKTRLVNWPKTDRYAASARYKRYAETRGEEDYLRLSNEVADVLNTIALTTDRAQALAVAERARATVAAWPQTHFGYRQNDIREIVSLLDQAISSLRAVGGGNPFELSLVAMAGPPDIEPVLGMPNVKEQLDQMMRLASVTTAPTERMALLQGALALVTEAAPKLSATDATNYRTDVERAIREEVGVDKRYTDLSRRALDQADKAAQRADSSAIERIVTRVREEDCQDRAEEAADGRGAEYLIAGEAGGFETASFASRSVGASSRHVSPVSELSRIIHVDAGEIDGITAGRSARSTVPIPRSSSCSSRS